jgi:hypothetical protein
MTSRFVQVSKPGGPYYGRIDAYDTLVAKRFKTTPFSKHARNISVNPTTNKLYVTVSGIFTNSLFVLEF